MRKAVDARATLLMIVLCLIWSFQQVAIKLTAADAAPILQVALRSGAAAVLVWLYGRVVARDRWLRGGILPGALAVSLLFAAEFLLVAQGLARTSASHVVVFLYTAPMFAALGLHLRLPDERLSRLQWSGLALAFLGIALAFLVPSLTGGGGSGGGHGIASWMLGDLLALAGGAAWGLTTVVVRVSRMSEAPATQTLFYQLSGAFAILLPASWLFGEAHFHGSPALWASLAFQTLFVCFASFLIWFAMLRRYLAARLGVLSFMTPIFGVAWGVLLLDEHPGAAFMAGAALVMAGLVIVNGEAWIAPWLARLARAVRPGANGPRDARPS
ncbi:DMT family transporter [Burkholderia sp. Ac-20379]|uniref:DMT family transporter n=1 Tax=Burkholderia sp. Ac-20379 TaxID=2703900 RepID=UPI00198109A6|nr:DMT family transporter [Burkholderia sp. Ac-20379]